MSRGVVLALVAAALAAAGVRPTEAAAPSPCAAPRVGLLAPLTGEAAFLGKEQLGFARFASRTVGERRVRIAEADTQLDPARATRAARTLLANPNVLAVVGPAGSPEVLAVARVFRGQLPFVSASALAAPLTNGSLRGFFRVVPSERAQAPTIARLIGKLDAAHVAVVDDGSGYSRRLAGQVQARLRSNRTTVTRAGVDARDTTFVGAVSRLPRAVDLVFLPFHVAATAQLFADELRRQGRDVAVVASDALDSRDFAVPGAYVTAFAPRVRVPGYAGRRPTKFGPSAYVATEVAIRAVQAACADGKATRREVLARIRATDLHTVLGRIRFTSRGDVRGASYAVFRLP